VKSAIALAARFGVQLASMRTIARCLPLAALIAATPALAMDLNSYRAAHGRMPLTSSSELMGIAYAHAADMARRQRLDHRGFRQRMGAVASTAAENVSYGCATEDCAIRQWARSGGHRRNMLMRGVSAYGIASAVGANGKRYWVLELGN
jgi:uncharacterized protein YkwD